jgi:spore coat protein JC
MVGTLVHQLTHGANAKDFDRAGVGAYFIDHTNGVYPQSAGGFPFSAAALAVKGDPIADLTEDMAAEQKARATYDNILRVSDDPDVNDVIKFLRQREVVHFQRFGETLNNVQSKLSQKKFYMPDMKTPGTRMPETRMPEFRMPEMKMPDMNPPKG